MIIELFELDQLKAYINTDNRGVILFAERGINQRTKHLDIRLKHLFDCSQRGEIEFCKVKSKYNVADMFTKFLKCTLYKNSINTWMQSCAKFRIPHIIRGRG